MRGTRRFVTEGGSDSCSMRVFINTGRRPDLSSRFALRLPKERDEEHVLQTSTKRKRQLSVIFGVHRDKDKRRSSSKISSLLGFISKSGSFIKWLISNEYASFKLCFHADSVSSIYERFRGNSATPDIKFAITLLYLMGSRAIPLGRLIIV